MTKKTIALGLGLAGAATPALASPPFLITGKYTADMGCVARPAAEVDSWLAAQAPFLERGPTVTPSGTHPVCPLSLRYDEVNGAPVGVDEQAHYVIDLKVKESFSCNSDNPLPTGHVSFIFLIHQSNAGFVQQSRDQFGYPAYLGNFARVHTPAATIITASANTPSNATLAFAATFHTRVPLNATGLANLPHIAAALDAPVFGVRPNGDRVWNQVKWNALPGNVSSENAVMTWSSALLGATPVFDANFPGLNTSPFGLLHFENVAFAATLPQLCKI